MRVSEARRKEKGLSRALNTLDCELSDDGRLETVMRSKSQTAIIERRKSLSGLRKLELRIKSTAQVTVNKRNCEGVLELSRDAKIPNT